MFDVEVIAEPAAAIAALDPIKARLLAELSEPASAAALAPRVGLTRQKVNYHLRALEENGLVRRVEERQWGGLTERLVVATAISYVVSPAALGRIGASPAHPPQLADQQSAGHAVALAARTVREVGELSTRAGTERKRLATLSIDTVIRFRSPVERAAFLEDLTAAMAKLAARYHDESAPGGRPHRLVVSSYPAPAGPTKKKGTRDASQEG
jgi:DNA-binding transcriptional ArsR family regulator